MSTAVCICGWTRMAAASYWSTPAAWFISIPLQSKWLTWLWKRRQPNQAVKSLQAKFQVSKKQALSDYVQIQDQIEQLVRPDGACPIHDLDLEIRAPFSATPLRALSHGPGDHLPLQQRMLTLL